MSLPLHVHVVVEVPRGGFVKWRSDGRIDYVSPLPSPFNYGAVPGTMGADGDPLDAVVLGPRLPRGHGERYAVHGVIRFVDAGRRDDKLVCGPRPVRRRDLAALLAFFRAYAVAKRVLNAARGQRGPTRCGSWERR